MASYAKTFKATATATLTATSAAVFTNSGDKPVLIRYVSEIASHISMTGAASVTDALVPANCIELLNVDPGKSLTAVRAASETDDTVWITEITQV